MTVQRGSISVQTENIFPIIKKFLYSDQEIFLRELVANATDATQKLLTLVNRGDITEDVSDLRIEVILDKENRTITVRDKGIGMTEEEMQKYLNQVAFSSAREFLDKYKSTETQIIGHFGLGFYSAFMVASKVEVISRSYQKDAKTTSWSCDGSPEYTIETDLPQRPMRGTDIVLHISDDADEYLSEYRIGELLSKYCKFLPIAIQFGSQTKDFATEAFPDVVTGVDEDGNTSSSIEIPNIVNNTAPLWKRNPQDLKDEDYVAFYDELYPASPKPLFWVHLNIDYPFNLTGVLYFPKVSNTIEASRNKIQLYSNQVFVTDEVKDIVPEFLMHLHGVIDSPDIPLNVSRSYLQSDRNVKRISEYITRKVADKLSELFRKDRPAFVEKWDSISIFVKYGIIAEPKFSDKAIDFLLVQNAKGEHFTLKEYIEKVKPLQTNKDNRTVLIYTNDLVAHDSLVQSAAQFSYDVLYFDSAIDAHLMQHLEQKDNSSYFARLDSDSLHNLVHKDDQPAVALSSEEQKALEEQFRKIVATPSVQIQLQHLAESDLPISITRPEYLRRVRDMSFSNPNSEEMSRFGEYYNIVLNTNHPTIAQLSQSPSEEQARYLYQLACLQQNMLKGNDLTEFIKKSVSMLK